MFMFTCLLVLLPVPNVLASWRTRTTLVNINEYFHKLVQETVYDLEEYGWCNLGIPDYTQNLNFNLYKWHVEGTATYSNGFLVSTQLIETSSVASSILDRTVDNVTTTTASVQGIMHFREPRVGFDVIANFTDEGFRRFSGIYRYVSIDMQLSAAKNLNTGEITTEAFIHSLSTTRLDKIAFLPRSNISEAVSREFVPSDSWNGVSSWATTVIQPMIQKIATTRLPFPDLCFNCI